MASAIYVGSRAVGHPSDEIVQVSVDPGGPLPEADVIVLNVADLAQQPPHAVGQFKIDLRRAFERGAAVVLLFTPGFHSGHEGGLMMWLRARFSFQVEGCPELEIRSLETALRGYFEDQLAYGVIRTGAEAGSSPHALAVADVADGTDAALPVAEIRYEGAGRLVLLPIRTPPSSPREIDALLDVVSRLPVVGDYPDYLDELAVRNEPELRIELEDRRARIEEIEREIEGFRAVKRILYLAERPLEVEVVRFLADELGIAARHAGGVDEDFWLVDDQTDWCIGEVKSVSSGSVDRQQVGKLDDHRKQAGKPDDFPALLVANTVYRRQTVAERDEPIAPNVRERAAADHILIVRTLDLFRLKQLEVRGESATEQFLEAVRNGGGWFEVDTELKIRVHPS